VELVNGAFVRVKSARSTRGGGQNRAADYFYRNLINFLKEDERELWEKSGLSQRIALSASYAQEHFSIIPENTLPIYHDFKHSERVLRYITAILRAASRFSPSRLNHLELFVLIESALLHDIGYFFPIEAGDLTLLKTFPEKSYLHRTFYKPLETYIKSHKLVDSKILSNYLRKAHHMRSGFLLRESSLAKELNISSFKGVIATVSEGHHEENIYSSKYNDFMINDIVVRVSYLACLLRLANVLDLASERVHNIQAALKDPDLSLAAKKELYKHYCTSGVSITTNNQGLMAIALFYRSYCKKDKPSYINQRVSGMIEERLQSEINSMREIMARSAVLLPNVNILPFDARSDSITENEIPPEVLEAVFPEPEFDFVCPGIHLVRGHEDHVVILERNNRLVCLYDEIEHRKSIGNYCLSDSERIINCGFCAAYGSASLQNGEIDFECPPQSFDARIAVILKKVQKGSTYRLECQNVTNEEFCKHCGFNPLLAKRYQSIRK
jgi:hypothetical protein